MGALASLAQRDEVRKAVGRLRAVADLVFGDPEAFSVTGGDAAKGAFLAPILLRCNDPHGSAVVHEVEAFGPVATLMPYDDLDDVIVAGRERRGQPGRLAVQLRQRLSRANW